jgi:hypothetical protein
VRRAGHMNALSHRSWLVAISGFALVAAYACSVDSAVDNAAGACVQGQSEACTCANGALGVRTCDAANVFETCQCEAPLPGGAGGFLPPVGGSAGSAGIDVGGDPGGAAGAAAGSDSIIDAGGAAGAAGSGGDGEPTAGAGGVGGSAGDAADAGVVEEPKPGEAYNPCRDDGSCNLPMFCTFDATGGGIERYCAPICNGNGPGPLSCPRRPDGSLSFCVRNLCMR